MAADESMMWSESADPSQVSALGRKPSSQVSCSKGESQRIARIGRDLLSDTVHQLRAPEGTILLEVACSTDSVLTNMMHEISGQSGSAQRLSIWNGYDLTTNSGLKSILDKIDSLKPEHVWLSPDCGPYSIMQNVNQRSPEQCEALAEKRRDALKQYTACAVLLPKGNPLYLGTLSNLSGLETSGSSKALCYARGPVCHRQGLSSRFEK